MKLAEVLLGAGAFALTVAETYVGARQNQAIIARRPVPAANWATAFEALLFVDILLIVHAWWLVFPILLGAWLGMWWSVKYGPKRPRDELVNCCCERCGSTFPPD